MFYQSCEVERYLVLGFEALQHVLPAKLSYGSTCLANFIECASTFDAISEKPKTTPLVKERWDQACGLVSVPVSNNVFVPDGWTKMHGLPGLIAI